MCTRTELKLTPPSHHAAQQAGLMQLTAGVTALIAVRGRNSPITEPRALLTPPATTPTVPVTAAIALEVCMRCPLPQN